MHSHINLTFLQEETLEEERLKSKIKIRTKRNKGYAESGCAISTVSKVKKVRINV